MRRSTDIPGDIIRWRPRRSNDFSMYDIGPLLNVRFWG